MAHIFTVLPGASLLQAERSRVRRAFVERFVAPAQRHLPFWFSFPLRPIPRSFFDTAPFMQQPALYVMLGKGHTIHAASGAAVSDFFRRQECDDDMPVYVFDDTYSWCVCSTDRLIADARPGAADFLTILVGDFPAQDHNSTA